ncbi:hypothetical protein DEI93_15105 [Curtobacterium sp. MCBD17_035]|uniref:hypothetical protein n=1 Tax=Curtobacterium sp. MCBD17_035 TaxID=2175673 RepID=UPI0011B82927|nr:hypothetical protein [Curtobacterium sp. MCBD17_035]WIB67263.1 hypothetical protein DEI93_15105 [Curtobacterium sp. MCBD17_035]
MARTGGRSRRALVIRSVAFLVVLVVDGLLVLAGSPSWSPLVASPLLIAAAVVGFLTDRRDDRPLGPRSPDRDQPTGRIARQVGLAAVGVVGVLTVAVLALIGHPEVALVVALLLSLLALLLLRGGVRGA